MCASMTIDLEVKVLWEVGRNDRANATRQSL